jgi:murein DD-endopeptidase MepM/ murein hydrolase activator NlpD
LRKKRYIVYYSRDEKGRLERVPIPLKYAYIFVTAALVGAFTITGIAGSYTRMALKTARFNQVRSEHEALRRDYKNLEQVAQQKDIQAASLGSLAGEITRFYGLRHGRVDAINSTAPRPAANGGTSANVLAGKAAATDGEFTQASYARSLQDFYTLKNLAISGAATQGLQYSLGAASSTADWIATAYAPTLWPIEGPVTSSFGEREDPFNGEGAFHSGIDISAAIGTPVHAPAGGTVLIAGFGNGYGREVVIDHGHGVTTLYGHLSGFSVVPGQQVSRGDVIGYVGDSGRSTGAHLHYEVRVNDQPVNPHKYMRETMADITAGDARAAM